MEHIFSKVDEMVNLIKETDVYQNYTKAKNNIDKNPVLKEKVFKLKDIQIENRIKEINKMEISLDEEKRISHLYSEVILIDEVIDFLNAEKNLLELITALQNEISSVFITDI